MGASGQAKRKNEAFTGHKPVDIDISNKVRKSICKIIVNKKERTHYGTGFFMKVSDSFRYLITNYHVINSEALNAKIEIEIWNKKNFILNMNNRNIHYLNLPKDITALEIKDSDDIFEDIEFLSYDKNYEDEYTNLKNADVFTVDHPIGKNASSASGTIIDLKEYEFYHNISIDSESSGCPILLFNDNINLIKVIGIHKNADKIHNIGTFIGEIIREIKKYIENKKESKDEIKIGLKNKNELKNRIDNILPTDPKNDLRNEPKINLEDDINIDLKKDIKRVFHKKTDNYILAEVYIEENNVNKDIRIINSYEETTSKESSKDYLFSGEDIRNEKEIKECQIEINDELIPFNYFYQFKNKGKYIIKYFFQNYLTSTVCIFNKCENLIFIDLRSFNTSNVTDMSYMFKECKKLKEIIGINKNKATNLNSMFKGCFELECLDLSNFDTKNVTDLSLMFSCCYKLKGIIGLNEFITNKVINMTGMFRLCNELEYLDLSSFDTSNVIDMSGMFNKCYKLMEIKGINKFITNKVDNMSAMFQLCKELEYLDLSSFDTSNIKEMPLMFEGCKTLKIIQGLNQFITNKVNNMKGMFQSCSEIEYLDLSSFDTSNVIDMSGMFNKCYKLMEIKGINKFVTNKVITMNAMFGNCHGLQYLDLSNFDTSNVTDFQGMFFGAKNLGYLNLLNFTIHGNTSKMFSYRQLSNCQLITNNEELLKIFKSTDLSCIIF